MEEKKTTPTVSETTEPKMILQATAIIIVVVIGLIAGIIGFLVGQEMKENEIENQFEDILDNSFNDLLQDFDGYDFSDLDNEAN